MTSCECRKPGMTNQLFRNSSLTEVEIVIEELLTEEIERLYERSSNKEFFTAIIQENKVTN
jgi:hypothetical protein